jgi:hypothetical protein
MLGSFTGKVLARALSFGQVSFPTNMLGYARRHLARKRPTLRLSSTNTGPLT